MRVGIFTNSYRPLISGVVNAIDSIRKELLRQGHTPWIYAPSVSGYREQHAGVLRYPALNLTRNVQYPLPFPYWPPNERAIGRSSLDILHSHHPFLLGDSAWLWARRRKIPLVYTFHTQYEQYVHYVPLPQAPLKALTRWAVSQYARRADLIIAPSPAIRSLLDEYKIRTWTETLPNAIDLSPFQSRQSQSDCRQRLGWPNDSTIALYAGRLGKEKNLEFLLQAFASLHERNPQARLAIVGDGPELENLRLQAHPSVLFSGRVAYQDIPDYYQAADLFCMSSTTEVKPLVVLEALAAGLPVVAVAACGTSDTLTDGLDGLLTEQRLDPFIDAWASLLDHPNRRQQMAQSARQTSSLYGIDNYVRRLTGLYQEARARQSTRTN